MSGYGLIADHEYAGVSGTYDCGYYPAIYLTVRTKRQQSLFTTYPGRWKHPSPLHTSLSLIKLFHKSDINTFQSLVIIP